MQRSLIEEVDCAVATEGTRAHADTSSESHGGTTNSWLRLRSYTGSTPAPARCLHLRGLHTLRDHATDERPKFSQLHALNIISLDVLLPTTNLVEASAFVDLAERMHAKIDEKIEHLREQMKAEAIAEKEQMKAQATAEKEQLRRELMPREVVTNEQLATLGSRLEAMHAAQLISDEILYVCPLRKHPLRLHP